MEVANPQQHNGSISELKAAVALMEQGYEIFIPMNRHSSFDLVAHRDGKIYRIEVKTNKCTTPVERIWSKNNFDVIITVYKDRIEYNGKHPFGKGVF